MEDGISKNLGNLAKKLFADEQEREAFLRALSAGDAERPAILWIKKDIPSPFSETRRSSWMPTFVQPVSREQGAGKHELHEAGAYYCLDSSSVFQISSVLALAAEPKTVVDMCASPGGKSVFLARQFPDAQLISNEVIRKRLGALIGNLRRCQIRSRVVSADVAKLAELLPLSAQLVVVDAPCSGQSLVARGKTAPSCFHPATINMNSNRQKRILANAGGIVAPSGYLVYSTCTFSLEENEAVISWFLKRFPQFRSVAQESLECYRSPHTEHACYRLYPQFGEGAGGFTCLLERIEAGEGNEFFEDCLDAVLVRDTEGIVSSEEQTGTE